MVVQTVEHLWDQDSHRGLEGLELPAGLELPPLPHHWRWLKSWSKYTHWAESGCAGSWEEQPIPSVCWHFLSCCLQGLMSSGCSLENNLIILQVDVTLS